MNPQIRTIKSSIDALQRQYDLKMKWQNPIFKCQWTMNKLNTFDSIFCYRWLADESNKKRRGITPKSLPSDWRILQNYNYFVFFVEVKLSVVYNVQNEIRFILQKTLINSRICYEPKKKSCYRRPIVAIQLIKYKNNDHNCFHPLAKCINTQQLQKQLIHFVFSRFFRRSLICWMNWNAIAYFIHCHTF